MKNIVWSSSQMQNETADKGDNSIKGQIFSLFSAIHQGITLITPNEFSLHVLFRQAKLHFSIENLIQRLLQSMTRY